MSLVYTFSVDRLYIDSIFNSHFGPLNTIAISPNGKCYASGGEDGYVRVYWFDPSFFTAKLYGPDLELGADDQ